MRGNSHKRRNLFSYPGLSYNLTYEFKHNTLRLVNIVIAEFSQGIIDQLKDNVVGIYLFGSLTYGDFNAESSDIDLMVVVNTPLTKEDILLVKSTHQ